MRITRPFVLLALAALLAPRAEASRTGVWESNPPAAAVHTTTNAAGLLAPLDPAGSLESTAADAELAEPQRFDLGDVVLVESRPEERFRIGLSDVVEPPSLRGPPLIDGDPHRAFELRDPETRIGGFELLPSFRVGASPSLSLWSHQACGFSCLGLASDSRYDPWGLKTFVNPAIGRDDMFGQVNWETGNSFVDFMLLSPINNLLNAAGGLGNTALNSIYGPLRALGWTDTDIEALNLYMMAHPAEVAAAVNALRVGGAQASAQLQRLLQRLRQAGGTGESIGSSVPVMRSLGAAANKDFQLNGGPRFKVGPDGTAVDQLPLAKPGEDLFVGSFGESKAANRRSGLAGTHTPHHATADAITPTTTYRGVTINLEQRLHGLTRTFKRNPVRGTPYELKEQLHQDVENIRQILLKDGYDYDEVERALNELVRRNYREYGLK